MTMLLSLFCLSMAGQNNQATQTLLGDANGDGVVNVADIVEINNYILGKPSSRFNSINADTNLDSYVTDDDILYIQDIILLHHYKNISLSGSVSLASNQANNLFDNYTVTSVIGDSRIKDGDFTLETYEFDVLQTVFVTDESDRVYMMARQPMDEGGNVEINVESTALGFVMIHPVLSALSRSDYNKICAKIKSSNYYQPFYSAVEKVIKRQQDLFDVNNTEMIAAYENLFDDLCNQIDFTQYDEDSSSLTRALTRSIENYDQFYPLSVRIYDNSISMWNTALFPSYYGTVTRPNGSVTNFNVLSADDWGWVEFLTHGMATYGEESRFWFNEEGEYRFRLSRVNQEATYDYYLRMTLLALSCLSLPVDNVPHQTLNTIINSLISIGGSLSDGSMSAAEITQTILSTVCNIIQNDALNAKWKDNKSYCQLTNLRKYANLLSRGMIIYNIAKGSSNILLRMIHALRVPEEVNFDLCYYNGNITQCKEAKLYKKSGDNQSGEENTVLELPLEVYVQIIGSDGMYYDPDVNYVVRFEVVSGEGSLTKKEVGIGKDGIVSTRWTLGYEGEQKVKAVVVDLLYELEIGEPVYFNATAVKRAASVNTDKYEKISETSYRLYGSYSGYDTRKTGFVYNTTGEPSIQNGTSIVGELLWDTFNAVVDNLNPGMTYYYRAFVNLDGVYIYGETKEFTTISDGLCPDNNHPHMIDLGLPSGIKWACCNVGANAPEQYGGYYAFGEIREKDDYSKENYQYYNNSTNSFIFLGTTDIASTSYDVAKMIWGGSWKMPSWQQYNELLGNAPASWTSINGVKGLKFTGPNGNAIFFPAAGFKEDKLRDTGGWGNYWTSNSYASHPLEAYSLYFHKNENVFVGGSFRSNGFSIRAIK